MTPRLIAATAALAAVAAASAALVTWLVMSNAYDPLGRYDEQRVVADRATSDGTPLLAVTDDVRVIGRKCVKRGAGPVDVAGTAFWQSIDPPGTLVKIGDGTATRRGCERFEFANPVPDHVASRVEELGGVTLWRITGTETPIRSDGLRGVPRTWTTETFAVAADG